MNADELPMIHDDSDECWDRDELSRAEDLAAKLRGSGVTTKLFAVRAPGRVNLIGEHTDYSGLPVMPIAIDRSTIIVAAARPDSTVKLRNADPDFPAREFRLATNIAPYPIGDWANYVKAGFQGAIDHFAKRAVPGGRLLGSTMIVDGRVPPGAGLSSSAALTVSSALSFMAVNGLTQGALETAQMVARSEWYVGTMAGGMDQAAAMLGQRDHALLIRFGPLRVKPVKMPPRAAIVVADSLEVADKSGRVREEYNRRVVECAIGARILGKAYGLKNARLLGDVVGQLERWNARDLVETLTKSAPDLVDFAQAAKLLNLEEESLRTEIVGQGSQRIHLDEARPLEILRRARHVLTETERVNLAAAALEAGRLAEMGALMDASHQSLRDDFEASTPRLDAMVECARNGGALGARLTGAGFGGCIIALARANDAPAVLDSLERGYYAKLGANVASHALHTIVHAGPGASVIELP
jgi:N-acetylgalactosamine kinase